MHKLLFFFSSEFNDFKEMNAVLMIMDILQKTRTIIFICTLYMNAFSIFKNAIITELIWQQKVGPNDLI